ncbi:hypothetical protein [Marinagarivorans cellulosilyticus]|uniref:Uncharacterized protein n=1 Tax=Marinagarivorans cellulosilyticus TaxID=2721545 RepID=A0AAN2BL68_9GAMM|nr:hypothetical protein [Marinagarivorans cellulosilyticus]BCD98808.1 hypothetical protein MARGE09_P3009 [Marinagarivorans cellulosilyticus]
MNSVMSAGYQGMVQSQQTMQRYAQNIASTNTELRSGSASGAGLVPPSQSPQELERGNGSDAMPAGEVPASQKTQVANGDRLAASDGGSSMAQNMVALKQQEQIFTASASVVEVGAEAVGSLIDDYT